MKRVPGRIAAAAPDSPNSTNSTLGPLASMAMTISAPLTASAGVAATVAPA